MPFHSGRISISRRPSVPLHSSGANYPVDPNLLGGRISMPFLEIPVTHSFIYSFIRDPSLLVPSRVLPSSPDRRARAGSPCRGRRRREARRDLVAL